MIEFSFEERQFINRCLARARADQRRHCVEELRALIESERQIMREKLAAVQADFEHDWAEVRRELDETRAELFRLRELHARARGEREEIARQRALVAFQIAQRDETAPLN